MKIKLGRKYTRAALFSLILLFSFSSLSFGQTEESPVVVPEQAMEQVVRRILVWYFKPRNQPKTIYLAAKGIKQSWLPMIENIEFELLSDEELEQREKDIYFFTEIEKLRNTFSLGFAFGNPNCSYIGDYWHFRIHKQKVKLWQNGAVGGGCGVSSGSVTITSP